MKQAFYPLHKQNIARAFYDASFLSSSQTKYCASFLWSKLSIFFTNKILRELGNKKILLYKLSILYLVLKLAYVNASEDKKK